MIILCLLPLVYAITKVGHNIDPIIDLKVYEPGNIAAKFLPFLSAENHACDPYPAITFDGSVSGGLSPQGVLNRDCNDSMGQTYSRITRHENHDVIMYAWFYPREGRKILFYGHGQRYFWLCAVLWFEDAIGDNKHAWRVTLSEDQGFGLYYTIPANGSRYWLKKDKKNLISDLKEGATHPLVDWHDMTQIQKDALDYHFGDGINQNCPLSESHYLDTLNRAYNELKKSQF